MNAYSSGHYAFIARWFIALSVFLCGVNSAPAESTDPGGGIGGTGITSFGVVQKFGSIFVNGREYFLDGNTQITRDGVRADKETLHRGDVVSVQGRLDAASGHSVAVRVDSDTTLQGAVEKVDISSGTLTVLGQIVRVTPQTLSDSPKGAPVLAGVRPGEHITVSGFARSDDSWTATRIAHLSADESRFVLHGIVRRAEPERGRLRVNGQDLSVPPGRFPSRLAQGDFVRVDGHYANSTPRVENIRIDQPRLGLAGQIVEMSGYIQAQPGTGQMISNYTLLRYSDASAFVGAAAKDLHQDMPVAVRGEMQADGSVSVREILVDVDPMRVVLPDVDVRTPRESMGREHSRYGSGETPGHEKPEIEKFGENGHEMNRPDKPEIERPEIERPEIEHPDIERPDISGSERED